MPIFDFLTVVVAPALAKNMLKLWWKDAELAQDVGAELIDLIKSKVPDARTQHRGERQLKEIGEQVAEQLLPLFEESSLPEHDQQAVVQAIADTLSTTPITPAILAQKNLNPDDFARYLLAAQPHASVGFGEAARELYRRTLIESASYIVDIASQLPGFSEQTLGEVLKRERQLLDIAMRILEEVQRIRSASRSANPEAEAAHFEEAYRRAVVRNLDKMELFGVDVAESSKRHRLSVAYVSLSLARKYVGESAPLSSSQVPLAWHIEPELPLDEEDDTTIEPVEQVLAHTRRLVVRGQAGSGKTTLLHWIAVNSAGRSFTNQLADWNNTIPFFIPLRRFVDAELPAPEAFPRLVAQPIADTMPKGWVHDALRSGRALVLVDSLDELPQQQRSAVRQWLKELVAEYQNAYFVVTSRPSAIADGWLDSEEFVDAELQPMEQADIFAFIDHWHEAVREEIKDDTTRQSLGALAENLKNEVRRNRSIRNLATNPLLCSAICALHRERRRHIPTLRIKLYEALYDMLLERRDKERNIRVEGKDYPQLNDEQKQVLIEYLAYWMMRNNLTIVSFEKVDERLGRKLRDMPHISANTKAANVRRLFVDRSGLLREPMVGWIDFTHRTFQEFLTAKAIIDAGDIPWLVEKAENDQWREVIILASGLASRKDREQLIQEIIERGDRYENIRHQLHLLAVACFESAVDLGPDLQAEVEKRLAQLIPPKNMTEAKLIAAAGDLAVPYLKAKKQKSPEAAACVRALALIGGEAAMDALKTYKHEGRQAVLKELLAAANAFDRETYGREVLANMVLSDLFLRDVKPADFDLVRYFSGLIFLTLYRSTLTTLEPLSGLSKLTELMLYSNLFGVDISPLSYLTELTVLNTWSDLAVSDLQPLSALTKLHSLHLRQLPQVRELEPLAGMRRLTSLSLAGLRRVQSLNPLSKLTNLTALSLYGCQRIDDLEPLAKLVELASLSLSGLNQLQTLDSLEGLTHLEILSLADCTYIRDLDPLANLAQLKAVSLNGFPQVSDLDPLGKLTNLTSLELHEFLRVSDLSPLGQLANLTSLHLYEFPQVRDLGILASLNKVMRVQLTGFTGMKDLSPLAALQNLNSLTLKNVSPGLDLSPLNAAPRLRIISVDESEEIVIPEDLMQKVRVVRLPSE